MNGYRSERSGVTLFGHEEDGMLENINVQAWARTSRPSPKKFWEFVASLPLETAGRERIGSKGGVDA